MQEPLFNDAPLLCNECGSGEERFQARARFSSKSLVVASVILILSAGACLGVASLSTSSTAIEQTHSEQQLFTATAIDFSVNSSSRRRAACDCPSCCSSDVNKSSGFQENDVVHDYFPENPTWLPRFLNGPYHLWYAGKELYLNFFTGAVKHECLAHHLNEQCCVQVISAAERSRWKFYIALMFATAVGMGIFKLGQLSLPAPPSCWKNRGYFWFLWDRYEELVDVTKELGPTIQELVDRTCDPRRMGKGFDGNWVTHKKLIVEKVERLENGSQWTSYKRSLNSMRNIARTLADMPEEQQRYAQGRNDELVAREDGWSKDSPNISSFLKSMQLDKSRNETVLFHGAPREGARNPHTGDVTFEKFSPYMAVMNAGFDDRLSAKSGMLGGGLYFADMTSKADCYAGKYSGVDECTIGEEAQMFLARIPLGAVYKTTTSLNNMRRPPCIHGHFDASLAWSTPPTDDFLAKGAKAWPDKGLPLEFCQHARYDTVMSGRMVDGGPKLYNEYAVFGRTVYPEYLIRYRRA